MNITSCCLVVLVNIEYTDINNMKKVLIRLFVVFCLTLSMVIVAPFHISKTVHANSTSLASPFLGVNYYVYDQERAYSYSIGGTPEIEQTNFESFYCYSFYQGACTMYQHRSSATNTEYNSYEINFNNTYIQPSSTFYTNNIYELEFILDNDYVGYFRFSVNFSGGASYSYRLFVNGNSVSQTVDGLVTGISITEVQLTKISNGYWTFPVESFTNIVDLFNKGFEQVGFNTYNDYMYPIFKEDSTKYIANTQDRNDVVVSFYTTRYIWNETEFNRYFSYNTSNFEIGSFNVIQRSPAGYIVTMVFHNKDNTTAYLNMKSLNSSGNFTVFYNRVTADAYPISTDFALQFGLQNDLLNDLNIIANGTNNSGESAADLQDEQSEFDSSASDLYQYENDFNESLNESLDDINVNFDIGNTFGSKFLTSASWVRQQFDALTSTSPFGSVLSFSLVLGIALLVIGKAVK